MKKICAARRQVDVKTSIKHRSKNKKKYRKKISIEKKKKIYDRITSYLNKATKSGLNSKMEKLGIIITLPPLMDFDKNYHMTTLHLNSISMLVSFLKKYKLNRIIKQKYKLASVNFDNLTEISTTAALVLTAEISNWEDSIRNKLKPNITHWNKNIYSQFNDLGFFDLFINKPQSPPKCTNYCSSNKKLVKYIKGVCGDSGKTKEFKHRITQIIGPRNVNKWTFLHSGLEEAITNVSHHAYPNYEKRRCVAKSWYITGSFNESTRKLKVVFYDQGVGIPKTLPTSEWKEQILNKIPFADGAKDEALLKAAMDVGRTRTKEADRGKGLYDLLTFVKERKSGRISILSGKGSYKFTIDNGSEHTNTANSKLPILGTLIIWSVVL